jgi:hypothetical protein
MHELTAISLKSLLPGGIPSAGAVASTIFLKT